MQQLNHSQIPQYIDYLQVDGDGDRGFYIAQELVEGQSFAQLIETGWRSDEGNIKAIAEQVLNILIYLHDFQPAVIHRDIKPQNLIQQPNGTISLVDFGAVQNIYSQTEIGGSTIVGTYGYMPPEQYQGKAYPATDLYSLGATLLYLLSGCLPSDFPHQRLKIDFRDRLDLSPTFADWLERLLDPTLEGRFSSAKEALTALKDPLSQMLPFDPDAPIIKSSWIKLQRSPERLKIEFPAANNPFQALQLLWAQIGLIVVTTFWLIVTLDLTRNSLDTGFFSDIYSGLYLLVFWLLVISACVLVPQLKYWYQGFKLRLAQTGLTLFAGLWLIWTLYYTRIAIHADTIKSFAIFLCWVILLVLGICLKYFCERTILNIDRQKVELTYRLLFYRQKESRDKTNTLARASAEESVLKDFETFKWMTRAIQLHYTDKSYRFGARLKPSEQEWIAREINNFLVQVSRSLF